MRTTARVAMSSAGFLIDTVTIMREAAAPRIENSAVEFMRWWSF